MSGTPLMAQLAWDAMPNASRYAVFRSSGGSPWAERTQPGFTGVKFQDQLPNPSPTYEYMVVAYYADGTSGSSPTVQFISPPMRNPTGFTLTKTGEYFSNDATGQRFANAGVRFSWNPVDGAVRYRLDGPGMPNTGHYTSGRTAIFTNIPRGPGSWAVSAMYPGDYGDFANPTSVSAVMRILPLHPVPWLTKNNGAGAAENIQTPVRDCHADRTDCYTGRIVPWNGIENHWLGQDQFGTLGLQRWLGVPIQLWYRTALESLGDPGFRTDCWQGIRPQPFPPTFVTVCYAAAHGYGPGEAGFADPNIAIKSMMIVKDLRGSVFMAFGPEEHKWQAAKFPLLPTVTLDTQGPKFVPFACLSCHGGRYNPQTRRVEGSHLLPLDPVLLALANPQARAGLQERVRQLNAMIVNSDPQSAVAAYIRGLYNGAVNQPGAQAQPDYVPQGWAPQAGFYRSVVKPYCAMCHIAAPSSRNFASWQNFQGNAALIHAAVCKDNTMPHAELQFKAFWTHDTGPVYTPGLLAAMLGYQSCQ